jgi:hypothetical protein
MPFKPGQSGNPLGRAKHVDPRSQDLEAFCREHQQDIKKVGEIALRRAVKGEEPWAIKLCLEYFYPKPGSFVAISREKSTEINLNLSSFSSALNHEDQQTFLKLWLKSKKGTPAFTSQDSEEKHGAVVGEVDEIDDIEFTEVNITSQG